MHSMHMIAILPVDKHHYMPCAMFKMLNLAAQILTTRSHAFTSSLLLRPVLPVANSPLHLPPESSHPVQLTKT